MNSSRLLSLGAIGVALVITVPPKLSDSLSDLPAVQQRLAHNLEQETTALLAREGFAIEVAHRFEYFEINAQKNDCGLHIREAAAEGYNVEDIKTEVTKDAQLVFEYRGKLWISFPTFHATISKFWNRVKWRLGADSSWSPVISIAAVGRCEIETLPWDELASIRAN